MPNVKLKTNLIVAGTFLKGGTMIDESKVPLRFRKKKYILRDGEIDYDAIRLKMQTQVAEAQAEVDEFNDVLVDEEPPKIRIANKRLGRR